MYVALDSEVRGPVFALAFLQTFTESETNQFWSRIHFGGLGGPKESILREVATFRSPLGSHVGNKLAPNVSSLFGVICMLWGAFWRLLWAES